MIEQMQQYYQDEKAGAFIAFIAAAILLIAGGVIWFKFNDNPLSKGIAVGFIAIAILLEIGGIVTTNYNNQKLADLQEIKIEDPNSLRQSELERMEKVMNGTFRNAFIAFAVLMILALVIIIFTKNYFWKGIGISFMILVALLIISDSFSMKRNKEYQEAITDFIVR